MYHMLSNAISDYIVSPLTEYVLSPLLNFVGNWGGSAVVNFVADNGGRAVLNFVSDWGGRATVNFAAGNVGNLAHTAAAIGAGLGIKKAVDNGYTLQAGVARLTRYNESRKNAGSLKNEIKATSTDTPEQRGRNELRDDSQGEREKSKSRSPSPVKRSSTDE